jgi:putative toxin-antitoxin system antitoxin component (TIGR02293 family)
MLANYDAKAVAEVMGIAFLRQPSPDASPIAASARVAKASQSVSDATQKFVINIGDGPVQMVEIRANNSLARFGKSKDVSNQSIASHQERVWSPLSVLIEKAVEKGLPRRALRHVAEQLAGDDRAKISSLEWIVVPKTTLERREEQLSPQESERTERVARLFVHARRALGTEAEARQFMTTPHPQLENRSPIDAARTDLGTRRTEQILNALEYGLAL